MRIQSEINRIQNNINAALDELEARGADVPAGANSDDLATLIASQVIPIANGGTGATTQAQAQKNLGVDISQTTIDMFADADYPID